MRKNFLTPTTVKEIKSYLELKGYYRNFVPEYDKIAKPIINRIQMDIRVSGSVRKIKKYTM